MGADKPTSDVIAADASLIESMRQWGADDDDIEALKADRRQQTEDEAACHVHPDCWDSVMLFLWVQTQWIWAGGGLGSARRMGLNRAGVEAELRMRAIPLLRWPELLADLQVIELAVLEADAERAEK